MMDDWTTQDFTARLIAGEFDEHLLEIIASLSTEELAEVAHASKSRQLQDHWCATDLMECSHRCCIYYMEGVSR